MLAPEKTKSFWDNILQVGDIVEEVLTQRHNDAKLKNSNQTAEPKFKMEFHVIESKFKTEILGILKNKSVQDLRKLRAEIEAKLSKAMFMMDRDYWESLCLAIRLQSSQMQLTGFYQDFREFLGTLKMVSEGQQNAKDSGSKKSMLDAILINTSDNERTKYC